MTTDETRSVRAYRAFQLVYAFLTLNFVLPAISYIARPSMLVASMDRINRALGGGPYAPIESGFVWHMLAVGNVMTLGWMCALLLADLRRFYPVLPALAFLKGFSSLYSLAIGIHHALPVFLFVFVLDGVTTFAMVFFAVRAHRLGPPPPGGRIQRSLERIAKANLVPIVPNLWQVQLGVMRMWMRLVFRSETVGTSHDQVRDTWRARWLHHRWIRFFPLVWERAIAPFDFSGLRSSPERVVRHLIGAHHDGDQFVYDLELLSCEPGKLEELRDRVRAIVETDDARSRWLRDLVVFDGYHERLLAAVDAAIAGDFRCKDPSNPDISLRAYLTWCAQQPATPMETIRAYFRFGTQRSPQTRNAG